MVLTRPNPLVLLPLVLLLAACTSQAVTEGTAGAEQEEGEAGEVALGQEAVDQWRIQTAVPSSSVYFKLLQEFASEVERMSGGRLKPEVLPDGAVVPALDILDAVDSGIVESGFAWANYWSGKSPASTLFSSPPAGGDGLDQVSHVAWLYDGGGLELYERFYTEEINANVKPLPIMPMGPDPLGWFDKPIDSLSDFRGLQYRAPPGIPGEVLQGAGITAVTMAGGEIIPAAERGVLDAAEWISPADDQALGFQQIWKNYYLQGLHQSTDLGELIVNQDFWDGLSPDLQAIVQGAAMATITRSYNLNVSQNAAAVAELESESGVTIRDTPEDFYDAFVKSWDNVSTKYEGQDPFFKEVRDSQRSFAKTAVPYQMKIQELYLRLSETYTNP